ncbi:MAG: hypothetical protein A3J14_01900 [Candidatus Levybacteria bacterium RIFCSPLOWO2_02_FULL_37_18]|nr:MAG: hypothetical protein A3J14_01900 [Candidatus Levybacteria bacterium RIFCSPLOWO2_02_FULL_37_18]
MKYKVITSVLVILLFFRVSFQLLNNMESIFARNYHNKYEHLYSNYYSSQYVKKDHPNIIPDNALEAFAGGIFLKGLNPILIVHDQPPLGRYIISFSILLFDNVSTIPVFLHLLSVVGLLLISKKIFRKFLPAVIPVGIFVSQSFFLNEMNVAPTLEPIQLPFIIFSLYFFIKGIEEKKDIPWFILSAIMVGFVISIRFFSLGVALVASMSSCILITERMRKKTIHFFLVLPLSILVLLLSYTKTIVSGYSILQIFGIQKYMLLYHQSKFTLPLTVWDLLMFNRWHTWWGNRAISKDPEWSVFWPISTILSFLNIIGFSLKKFHLSISEKVLSFWIVWYMILLSLGYSSTRYFLPLIPFLYMLGFAVLYKLFNKFRKSHDD